MVESYYPTSLAEALEIRQTHTVVPYAGGTDLMLKDREETPLLFLKGIPELREVRKDSEYLRIGAGCTFTELLASPLIPDILKAALRRLAAPAIRNMGTSGGNICNGSPKADSALIYYVLDAKVHLCSSGGECFVPIDQFYVGRGKTILQPTELLTEILLPLGDWSNYYYEKVGARKALAISRLSFGGLLEIKDDKIVKFSVAFGAIDNTILRMRDLEAQVVGLTVTEAKARHKEILDAYGAKINPISGRISARYRKQVSLNLLNDFLVSKGL